MQNGFNHSHVHRLQAAAAARLNNFHGPKRQLLGNKAVPAPAWKTNVMNGTSSAKISEAGGPGKDKEVGSKILLSRLPVDVTSTEVEVSYVLSNRQ
jgi:THO complex subunit 4